jgi:hypothetical protein
MHALCQSIDHESRIDWRWMQSILKASNPGKMARGLHCTLHVPDFSQDLHIHTINPFNARGRH